MAADLERVKELVRRSAPDPKRQRLPEDLEEQFVDVDRESAACYAQMEDLSARAAAIAAEMECDGGEDLEVETTSVIDAGGEVAEEVWDEESLVVHIDETRRAAAQRRADTDDGTGASSSAVAEK